MHYRATLSIRVNDWKKIKGQFLELPRLTAGSLKFLDIFVFLNFPIFSNFLISFMIVKFRYLDFLFKLLEQHLHAEEC